MESIEMTIANFLRQRGLKLALAESCTGGLIADRITNIPGASEYFLGGVVAYSYAAKASLLRVSWDTLRQRGAVSHEAVIEMARGARTVLGADLALSVSGIAGPGGAMPGKPVGYTWLGLSAPQGDFTRNFIWNGSRRENKQASADAALIFLLNYLQNNLEG